MDGCAFRWNCSSSSALHLATIVIRDAAGCSVEKRKRKDGPQRVSYGAPGRSHSSSSSSGTGQRVWVGRRSATPTIWRGSGGQSERVVPHVAGGRRASETTQCARHHSAAPPLGIGRVIGTVRSGDTFGSDSIMRRRQNGPCRREHPPRVTARTARKHTGVRTAVARTTRISVCLPGIACWHRRCPFPARNGPDRGFGSLT
jgi:hypothetical protein